MTAAPATDPVLGAESRALFLENAEAQEIMGTNQVGLSASVSADEDVAVAALARLSLFSSLPPASLKALAGSARQGEIQRGAHLFHEGDAAESFFILLDGNVEITRQVEGREHTVRHLGRGEALGLLGLFAGEVRAAGARAASDALVLEVPSEALNRLVLRDPARQDAVFGFYRDRLLAGFLSASPLFASLDSDAKTSLLRRFEEKKLPKDETLAHPGEVANHIVIVLSGSLMLERRLRAGEPAQLYELYPGQFVACMSALAGEPLRMRLYAAADSTVLMLSHRELAELFQKYPTLQSLPAGLAEHSRAVDRDIYCGHTGIPGL